MMTPSSPSHQEHPSSTSSRPSSKTNIGCSSLRPLIKGAYHDIRNRQLFSPFYTDRVLDYFDGVIGLVSVFLYEELDYDQLLNAREDPTALLLSLLCYFHVMVFFLNVHHFLKFSPHTFSILQVWLIFAASLGLVCYPLSLAAWIEQGGGASMDYIIINTSICFVIFIFNILTTIDERANGLYRVWHRFAPLVAFVYYGIALILNLTGVEKSIYMVYIAPFTFMFPLGAARDEADNSSHENNEIETQQQVNIFVEAFYDVKKRNIFSPYPSGRILDYFDAIVGLATVFLFIETLGWQNTLQATGGRSTGLLFALLCFFHVMVYWMTIHHALKFSPDYMSVISAWLLILFSLGLVLYPLCLTVWLDTESLDMYYQINLILVCVGTLFFFSIKIEDDRGNKLYRLWHKAAPIAAILWYSIAYLLFKIGKEQRWMIIMAPFCFMFPLGADVKVDNVEEVSVQDDTR
jgi:hypothetical protein